MRFDKTKPFVNKSAILKQKIRHYSGSLDAKGRLHWEPDFVGFLLTRSFAFVSLCFLLLLFVGKTCCWFLVGEKLAFNHVQAFIRSSYFRLALNNIVQGSEFITTVPVYLYMLGGAHQADVASYSIVFYRSLTWPLASIPCWHGWETRGCKNVQEDWMRSNITMH